MTEIDQKQKHVCDGTKLNGQLEPSLCCEIFICGCKEPWNKNARACNVLGNFQQRLYGTNLDIHRNILTYM